MRICVFVVSAAEEVLADRLCLISLLTVSTHVFLVGSGPNE